MTCNQCQQSWEQIPVNFLTEHTPRPTISIQVAKAIKELRTDQSRIILTADKVIAVVIMDRQDYNTKALELLDDKDTYRPILKDPTPKYKSQLINLLKSCKTQGQINQDTYKKIYPTCASTPKFYGLPQIHKTGTPKTHSIQ